MEEAAVVTGWIGDDPRERLLPDDDRRQMTRTPAGDTGVT